MSVPTRVERFGGASVRGAAHKLHNLPNQDAFGGIVLGDWTIIAVSDGHGAPAHFRSDRGARFAIEAVHQAMVELAKNKNLKTNQSERLRVAFAKLPSQLVKNWREQVARDVSADPIQNIEGVDVEIAYGATCIMACLAPDFSFYAQIGDGDLVVGKPDGALVKPLPDDRGLVGQQTYSLCQPDAPARFRTLLHVTSQDLSAPGFVLAATDGLAKSFSSETQFWEVAGGLERLSSSRDMGELSKDLGPWLDEVSQHGNGDDVTVMIFRDRDRQPRVSAPPSKWFVLVKKLGRMWS